MVAGIVLGDLPAAVVEHLRADADVAALAQGRISIAFPEGERAWQMPDFSIIVRPTGGPAPNSEDNRRFARVDIRFYGKGKTQSVRRRTARQLWRTTEPALCPPAGRGIPMGFRSTSGCIVYSVRPDMSEPIAAPVEPGTDWDCVLMPYLIQWAPL